MTAAARRPLTPVAVVVSPHGFGHAARASAVMAALAARRPELEFHVMTTVPKWFFGQSVSSPLRLHRLTTDVGLVQRTPLDEDLAGTARRLDVLLTERNGALERLAGRIERLRCRLVIADISPLGIAAAHRLGIPAVLIENFTWDWIYRGYADLEPRLRAHAETLARLAATADLHLQTEPVCRPDGTAVTVPPVARRSRLSRSQVRRELGVPADGRVVLLTMGGIRWSYDRLDPPARQGRAWFVVPGGSPKPRADGRVLLLPFRSEIFHPDLVQAADVVVGKLGYSTVAEVYHGGAAMAFVGRSRFRESAVLADFVRRTSPAVEISEGDLHDGGWLRAVDRLLDASPVSGPRPNGADQAADVILERFRGVLR